MNLTAWLDVAIGLTIVDLVASLFVTITAFALSSGAPFWFDVLNRFVSIRHGMRKPDSGAS